MFKLASHRFLLKFFLLCEDSVIVIVLKHKVQVTMTIYKGIAIYMTGRPPTVIKATISSISK